MKRFVKEIVIFFIPLIILIVGIIPVAIVGYKIGEFKSVDKWITAQRNNESVLVGLGYNEQTSVYKLKNCNEREADVIALGTSRVMQFKEYFFNSNFYNCGGAVSSNYNEYLNFLQNLNYNPKMIILGLDAWVFNDAWNGTKYQEYEYFTIGEVNRNRMSILVNMYEDWALKKWSYKSINNYAENIGFNGRVKNSGFMYDGSYYYGDMYLNPEIQKDYKFVDTFNRIETGTARFEWGEHIDEDAITQLENLLSYCEKNNIEVVGFIAPFAPSVYRKMCSSGKYGYINEITSACKPIFDKYDFELYDYMDGAKIYDDDSYFIDGFHGSEVIYGKMLLDMTNNSFILDNIVNKRKINELLNERYNGLVFFKP